MTINRVLHYFPFASSYLQLICREHDIVGSVPRLVALLVLPLLEPLSDKANDGLVRISNLAGRQMLLLFSRRHSRLVPVVHAVVDKKEGFAGGGLAVGLANRVDTGSSPRVLSTVDVSQARVAKLEAAILVDGVDVGRLGDVEEVRAVPRCVVERHSARHEGQLVLRHARASDKEAVPRKNVLAVT